MLLLHAGPAEWPHTHKLSLNKWIQTATDIEEKLLAIVRFQILDAGVVRHSC
jgi:hypothetical protein